MDYNFTITRTTNPKEKPAPGASLGFGKYFSDHMFMMDYHEGQGWHDGRIIPYQNLSMDPASTSLHYGQMMFEGLKAYRNPQGKINLFRPDMNAKRLNRTNDRMCIPPMDEDLFIEAVKAIVKVDEDWIPTEQGCSLYIRPFILSPEVSFSVLPAKHYWFVIIVGPVGAYYEGNESKLHGSHIWVEEEYIRAALGGTGFAKCGGNYGCGMKAAYEAKKRGCEEVLWLDAKEHKYVEEVGTSNAFFMIGDTVITSSLSGSILPGVTRDSVLQLLRKWGVKVEERRLEIAEVMDAIENGTLREAWATGTACVISPIGVLHYHGTQFPINNEIVGDVSQRLYDTLYGMQIGTREDDMGWIVEI
ncbi:MAG: branched-chain amino acid aminotransferase [Firmicutes bacterium]|nr:branched-chain amino acid aminotransferase [Bacillota bacterium]